MHRNIPYVFAHIKVILLLVIPLNLLFSQDTNLTKAPSDSLKFRRTQDTLHFAPIISQSKYQYVALNNIDTMTRNRFLWYPLKTFEDIYFSLPGYFLNFMEEGQIQRLNYDQLDNHYTTVLRHGRPINDLIDGSVDFNLFSRNEIAELELSNGYGNSLYNYNNVINMIPRQEFQNRPFSEISYWQDLNENLNFDGSFHKNFVNQLNFNFGIKKHSFDGFYTNSSFDQWAGRFNLNYFGSWKLNAFLYSNYSKIQRGLNEGLDVTSLKTFKRDEIFDQIVAVQKPYANETRERFDVDAGAIYAYGKNQNSFMKIQLFTSNSYRRYQDSSFVDVTHWINYGVKVQGVVDLPFFKGFGLKSSTEAEHNTDLIFSDLSYLKNIHGSGRQYFIEKLALSYKNVFVDGFIKGFRNEFFAKNIIYINYGLRSQINLWKDTLKAAGVYSLYTFTNRIPTYQEYNPVLSAIGPEAIYSFSTGAFVKLKNISIKTEYYYNSRIHSLEYFARGNGIFSNQLLILTGKFYNNSGINANININFWKINLEVNHQYNINYSALNDSVYPRNSGNISLSYHSMHFKNKLEVKIGLTSRYFTSYYAPFYESYSNDFYEQYTNNIVSNSLPQRIKLEPNATLDFFVIAKINKAIFGITFENIVDRAFLTTNYYPNQSRGGLFSVWSRFNLTWYFLN